MVTFKIVHLKCPCEINLVHTVYIMRSKGPQKGNIWKSLPKMWSDKCPHSLVPLSLWSILKSRELPHLSTFGSSSRLAPYHQKWQSIFMIFARFETFMHVTLTHGQTGFPWWSWSRWSSSPPSPSQRGPPRPTSPPSPRWTVFDLIMALISLLSSATDKTLSHLLLRK